MKTLCLLNYALLASFPVTDAYPGMGNMMSEMRRHADKFKRQSSKQLLGDLNTLPDSQLTPIGHDIKNILLDNLSAQSDVIDTSIPAGGIGTPACKADLCCHWKWLAYEMVYTFNGTSGRCNRMAREAVRMGFHDAGVWSTTSGYGGADGSILLTDEINRVENLGLANIADQHKQWYAKYNQYGLSMADIIQMGATVATVTCPLGPRLRSFVGRKDNPTAGPPNLLPAVTDSADSLLNLFAAKTINAHDLVTLVGAHTTSQQHFVNTNRSGDPQDQTPGIWDVQFYPDTLGSPPVRVLKFQSDITLSQDPRSSGIWKQFSDPNGGQPHWNDNYAKAYTRLSLLGVNNINNLQECTKILPPRRPTFVSEDQAVLNLWLAGQFNQLNDMVDNAIMLTGITSESTTTIGGKRDEE